ncbi:MAG: transcription elongation factor GreA [Erysipelotrichaceae bacterium]|jgi:transcription elongation factor GreA|nr:transcription elongation factor GreA [Erysipelotrichaceae bacterium]HCY06120.1 transcription elongation factor GreA [Erysipelotrichaceae bacterium]
MTNEKIYVTEEGLKDLQEQYNNLVHVVREEITEELKAARAQGDLSENADYDAARDRQAQNEAKIRELEFMLGNYEIIDTKKSGSKTVKIGSTVKVEFMDTKELVTYTIVGSTESDPLNGKLSNVTPLAEAILERKVGSTVTVDVENSYKVTIVAIE